MELSLLQVVGLLVLGPTALMLAAHYIKALVDKGDFNLLAAVVLVGCVLGVLAILGVLH